MIPAEFTITATQAAEILKVSKTRVLALCNAGTLVAELVDFRWALDRRSVNHYRSVRKPRPRPRKEFRPCSP